MTTPDDHAPACPRCGRPGTYEGEGEDGNLRYVCSPPARKAGESYRRHLDRLKEWHDQHVASPLDMLNIVPFGDPPRGGNPT